MEKISVIGNLLKKSYRRYSQDLLEILQDKGFIDLRASFLEILMFVCDNDDVAIKEIGYACGLKKQTMTSHLNELQKRDYILRKAGKNDKREQRVYLTEYGQKFKIVLLEASKELEENYLKNLGDVELERVSYTLENFYNKISKKLI